MSEIKSGLLYSEEHEWTEKLESGVVRIGISDYAQHQLGDIVFVELPEVGTTVQAGESIGTIESVKTVSDLYTPVSGKITKVNAVLIDQPELVNNEPYAGGWMIEIQLADGAEDELAKLLDVEQYREFTEK